MKSKQFSIMNITEKMKLEEKELCIILSNNNEPYSIKLYDKYPIQYMCNIVNRTIASIKNTDTEFIIYELISHNDDNKNSKLRDVTDWFIKRSIIYKNVCNILG